MAKGYIPLPDGSYLTVRDDETPGEAILRAQREYPEAFGVKTAEAEPEGGFGAAFKAGVSGVKEAGLALAGRTGLMDEEAARKAIEEEQAYQRRTFAPTEEGFLEAPLTKTAELLGQSLPYMAAPLVAAGAAAALPVTGTAATVAGLGAAGLASGAQFTGTNLLRQMETGKSIGETDLGNAALAAVPQAALDTLSLRMMPFIRGIFGKAGKELTEEAALEVAKKTLKDGAADYALATGRTMGVEGLTETAQQALERMQAGLAMGDEAARDEYLQSFIGGAVLGGVLAPPGRYLERRGIQADVEKREADIAAEEQRRQTEQEESRKVAEEAGAPLLTGEEATMQSELLGPASPIGLQAKLQREDITAAEQAATEERAQELRTTFAQLTNSMEGLSQDIGAAAEAKDTKRVNELIKEQSRLDSMLKQIKDIAKTEKVKLEAPVFAATKEKAAEQLDDVAKLQAQIKRAESDLLKATDRNVRDYDKAESVTKRLDKLNAQLTEKQDQLSLFGEENVGRVKEEQRLIAEEEANIQRGENVFNASKRIIRQARRQTEQEKETAQAQAKALERIEFKLKNMGLSALDIPSTRRKAIEEQINRGIVLPPTAELLGISVDKRTTADKALPQIEDAIRELNAQRQPRLYDILNDRVQLLDEKGELTDAGRQALADEAKMQELNRLRTVGLSKLDSRAAELAQARFERALELDRQEQQRADIAAEAPATERFGRIAEQQTRELKEAPTEEDAIQALKDSAQTKNTAFEAFRDAVYPLQRGQFLGAREGVPERLATEERTRNERLRDQIFLATREANQIKDRLAQPGVQRNAQLSANLQRRLTQLEGELKQLRAGLTRAPEAGVSMFSTLQKNATQAADEYVAQAMKEIDAARLAARRPALTGEERTDTELKLRAPFQAFIDRVSTPTTEGRIGSIGPALQALRGNIDEVTEEAKGAPVEPELPVETGRRPSAPPKKPPVKPEDKELIEIQRKVINDNVVEVSNNQKKLARITNQLQKAGSEVARLRKQVAGKKDPEARARIKEIDSQMAALRKEATMLKNENKKTVALLKKQGVDTSINKDGEFVLRQIEEDGDWAQQQRDTRGAISVADRKSAVEALKKRITATQERFKAAEKIEEDLTAAMQIGRIKTPEGKELTVTKVRRELTEVPFEKRPESIASELEILAQQRAALEEQKKTATPKERQSIGGYLSANTKNVNRLKAMQTVALPMRTAETIYPTSDDLREMAEKQQRILLEDVKNQVTRKTELEVMIEAEGIARDQMKVAQAELNAAKDKREQMVAKAKLKSAQTALTRATVARYELEQKLEDFAAESTNANPDDNIFLSLEEADKELKDALSGYRKNTDYDWRVGDTDFEVAVDEAEAADFVKGLEAKAKSQNIKFKAYKDFSEVPMKILKALARQGMSIYADKIKGGVAPDGEVFVIISHHANLKDLEQTAAHELVGHYTLEGLLGKDGIRRLLKRVEDSFPGDPKTGETGVFALAKELGVLREAGDAWLESVESTKDLVAEGKMTKATQAELARMKALREVLAYTTENYMDKAPASKEGAVKKFFKEIMFAIRRWLTANGFANFKDVSTPELFSLIKSAYKTFDAGKAKVYRNTDGTISLRGAKPKFNPTVDANVVSAVDKITAPDTPAYEKLKANLSGLNFRTQFIDRFDALERIKRIGQATLDKVGKPLLDSYKATDLLYFARKYAQRTSFVSEAMTNGVSQLMKDPKTGEFMLSRDLQKDAASMKKVAIALSKAKFGDVQANETFLTSYLAVERAQSEAVGLSKLGAKTTPADVKALLDAGRADPAIQEARKIYNEYNKDLINLLEQTGYLDKEKAAEIKARKDYIPFYRADDSGTVDLFIGDERIVKMGDLTEQPHLKELLGSDQKIRSIFVTSLQNTNMIMDLALRNLATRNVGFVLQGLGIAKRVGGGTTGTNVIRAKIDGKDAAWMIDTKNTVFGDIPAEIIVKGMDGIKSTIPGLMKVFSLPSDIFRKFITRDPAYAIRQIFRDSTAAYMATGSDATPVLGALRELKNMYGDKDQTARKLMAAGLSGGQVITGDPADVQKILLQVSSGKPGWEMAMAKLDGFAMAGDMATRVAAYKSFIKQGLSDRQADLAALEIMNFSRRGLSPSILFLNSMIPFLSANIQGLDVLFRAFKGQMGYNERLKIQEKLFKRGAMMALMTGAYALAMDDDETYENARPSERYSNWFVPVPGIDGALRVPIPFELGLIFKVLPEAVIRAAASDDKGGDIIRDMKDMLMKSVPGDIPLAMKPAFEVMANYSFFTNSAVVGARLSGLDAAEQYTDKTPELLKSLGALGISPAKAEYLVRGYTGSLGIGLLGFTDAVFSPSRFAERIEMGKPKDFPLLGRLIQPNDGVALIDKAYDTVEDARIAQRTYNAMLNEGRNEEARVYLKKVMDDIQMSSAAGTFTQIMGEISLRERQIKASTTLSPEEKRQKLDELRQKKIDFAKRFQEMRKRLNEPRDTGAQTERQAA